MMRGKKAVSTSQAPEVIGTYSQAIKQGNLLFISGQIPVFPPTGQVLIGTFEQQVAQVFDNIKAIAEAAGATLTDIVKLTVFVLNYDHFSELNQVMERYFSTPYPARSTIAVAGLPKNVPIEIEAILALPESH